MQAPGPHVGAVAETRVHGHSPGRPRGAVAGHDLAREELDRRQVLAAPEVFDRLAVAGAHDGDTGAAGHERLQEQGEARGQLDTVRVGGEQLAFGHRDQFDLAREALGMTHLAALDGVFVDPPGVAGEPLKGQHVVLAVGDRAVVVERHEQA